MTLYMTIIFTIRPSAYIYIVQFDHLMPKAWQLAPPVVSSPCAVSIFHVNCFQLLKCNRLLVTVSMACLTEIVWYSEGELDYLVT